MPPEITSNRALGSTVASSRAADDGTAALSVAIIAPDGTHTDGGAEVLGETTDASVAGDNNATVAAKLRYLNKVLADVYDSVNHVLKTSASISGTGGDGAIVDGVDSNIKASVLDYTNANPVAVRLTDTNGDYAAAGAGTQYTEDAAAAGDPIGSMNMAVRADALAAVTTTDGDNIALRATNKGELYVKQTDAVPVTDNGGALTVDGSVSLAAAIPAGTNNIGDVDVLTLPALPAGTNNIGDVDVLTVPADPFGVNADAVVAAGAAGSISAKLRRATQGLEDLKTLIVLAAGANAIGKLAANTGVTIGAVEIAAAQTLATVTTVATLTGGGIAHDGIDSGNPVKVGAKCSTTLADDTMVASGDRTDATSDADGALLVRTQIPLGDLKTDATSNTDGASTASSVFTAVASTRNVVMGLHVFRTDAGTSTAYVDFRDGTAGSVLYRAVLPQNGGCVIPAGSIPLFRTTANTALAYDVSSALSTVYINAIGFQSKV